MRLYPRILFALVMGVCQLGKRKKRGLFQSSIGKLINADINGAIGIGRKVFGDSYVSKIIDSGLAFNPVRVNIL